MYLNDRIFDPRDPQLVATIATTTDAYRADVPRYAEDRPDFRNFRAIMLSNRGTL
jgi:hypothetical protein